MKKEKPIYRIYSSFDTETTNIYDNEKWRAFPVAYMFGDLYKIDIEKYEAGDEDYFIYRKQKEAIEHIQNIIDMGKKAGVVPIIVAYNLMFDLQTLLYDLNSIYECEVLAQSATNVYTLDLLENGNSVLRFWDCFHLDMRGLAAMGDVCGMKKLNGDWDYDLVRTPETPLTEDEKGYARRDIQVIPAYLRYILESNPWITPDDLGVRVLTKTSIVRTMAQREIGNLKVETRSGKKQSLFSLFTNFCLKQFPNDFNIYGLRKACFRGGFTFTAAKTSMVPVQHVCSLDVTSMHHAFINGRKVPVNFNKSSNEFMNFAFDAVTNTDLETVLNNYYQPFPYAFHGQFLFKNIRLKEGSCFADWGIGLIPRGKFVQGDESDFGYENIRNVVADNQVKISGYVDRCKNGTFAFSKLMEAGIAVLFLNEIESWCMAQVYEWDSVECLFGESTARFVIPPDFVTLQSMRLYKAKDDMKHLLKIYKEGKIDQSLQVPELLNPMKNEIRLGNVSAEFLESFYQSTVKGMFNGIYGTMAQDILKPDYLVESGDLFIDKKTITNDTNYDDKKPSKCKVLYTYGMRIVGGSRQHLIIAMMLLYKVFKNKIDVTGGDTDSLKVRCDYNITPEMLLDALDPLHSAATTAISICTQRARELAPQWSSRLDHVGCFEVEGDNNIFYDWHMEMWNKARVSWDGHAHVTCAGLSRPEGTYTYEDALEDIVSSGMSIPDAMRESIGFNVCISNEICHALEHSRPKPNEKYIGIVKDYMGNEFNIESYAAISLYPTDRILGDTTKAVNFESLLWLQTHYNRDIDTSFRILKRNENGKAFIERV